MMKIRLGEIRFAYERRSGTVTSSASMLAGRRLFICSHVWGLPGTLSPRLSEGGVSSRRSSIRRVGTRWVRPRGGLTTKSYANRGRRRRASTVHSSIGHRNARGTPRVPRWGRRSLANSSSGKACRDYHGKVPEYGEEGLSLV